MGQRGMNAAFSDGMVLRALPTISVLAVFALGCADDVQPAGGGGSGNYGECPTNPPASEGPCAGPWECIDGEWVQGDPICVDPLCPVEPPTVGEPCTEPGYLCDYGPSEEFCDVDTVPLFSFCDSGAWEVVCSSDPPCPDSLPSEVAPCGTVPRSCVYDQDCGTFVTPRTATCDPAISPNWSIPEVVCPSCPSHQDPAACTADAACIWLEPGCDAELPPVNAGCKFNTNCFASGCPAEDLICTAFTTDPCWD